MYHNDPNKIELHDDVLGIEKAHLEVSDGAPVKMHVVFIMRPDRKYIADKNANVLLHSTNGVNHRLSPLNAPDPALDISDPSLNYYEADFNDDENDATRAMRRQQELVDASTAKKNREGSGPGTANSLRQREADAETEKLNNKKDK